MTSAVLPLGPLERAFVASLQRLEPQTPEAVLLAAALCCEALAGGDVCLPLRRLAGRRPWPEIDLVLPALEAWRAQLEASPLVGGPGAYAPLILDGERLYLARYQAYEQQLAERLLARASDAPEVDEACLADSLARLFAFNRQTPDWQRLAAAQAVRRRLAVISGGPRSLSLYARTDSVVIEIPGPDFLRLLDQHLQQFFKAGLVLGARLAPLELTLQALAERP